MAANRDAEGGNPLLLYSRPPAKTHRLIVPPFSSSYARSPPSPHDEKREWSRCSWAGGRGRHFALYRMCHVHD